VEEVLLTTAELSVIGTVNIVRKWEIFQDNEQPQGEYLFKKVPK